MKKKSNPFLVPVYSLSGRLSTKKVALNPEVFGINPNEKLIAQAVRVYLARRRNAFPKTKTRGEIKGSRRKIWAQKGTGRARHGDRYAPIFVGGGIAHGPHGKQNFNLRLSKKMKRLAIWSIFSLYFANKKLLVTTGWQKLPQKTRQVEKTLAGFFERRKDIAPKVGIILADIPAEARRGWRNLKSAGGHTLSFRGVENINAHWLLSRGYFILNEGAVKALDKWVKEK